MEEHREWLWNLTPKQFKEMYFSEPVPISDDQKRVLESHVRLIGTIQGQKYRSGFTIRQIREQIHARLRRHN